MNRRPHQDNTFDALMEAAVDAIVLIDEDGLIERFNSSAEQMFGYSEQEVAGRNVRLLMPAPHRSQHDGYIKRYRESGKAAIIGSGREVTARRKNGETFPILLTVGEFHTESGHKFVGFVRDLSESQAAREQVRQLEKQLAHADRLVSLGELTAGIAHEINQPLTAIAAYADAGKSMLDRGDPQSAESMQTICTRIGQQSRRAAEVIQRLRNLVRTGSVAKARHDIRNIIKNVLLLFEYEIKKRNIEIEYTPPERAIELYVDDIQIQQVLVNLVKNSLDALEEADIANGTIHIEIAPRGDELKVSVSDNGPGIPERDQRMLFEAFYTTKPDGVGLGLSICRSIASSHGGTLKYAASPQGGARFTLGLPLESIG